MDSKLEKLKAQKAALEAQIRQELGRERARQRKADTRRKILAGAAVLSEAEERPAFHDQLMNLLARFLTKPEDRALFELPPRAPDNSRSARADGTQSRPVAASGTEAADRQLIPG